MNQRLKFVISHDVGTSSVKSVLIDNLGNIHAVAVEEYPINYPNPGWVEQNPEDYWNGVVKNTQKIINTVKVNLENIVGIVFTPQAMGIIPIDDQGNVLHANITWVDGRAEQQAQRIMRKFGGRKIFKSIIGIEITGKDVIAKLLWLKQRRPEIYNKTRYFLDVNAYLKFKATGEAVFEWSGACSYAFNLKKKDFDRIVFRFVGIDLRKLPPLVSSIDPVGSGLLKQAAHELGLLEGTPVFGGCDDVQSATVGSTAIDEGEAHIYLGTSAWLSVSTAKSPKFKNNAVTLQSADPGMNVVVGITESAGANLEWAAKELYKSENVNPNQEDIFALMDKEIHSISPGSEQLIVTPWFLGERCPINSTTTR
ncbi:MAG: xylulokinase, partial [Candidatus Kariarchaeaceae archaeon]